MKPKDFVIVIGRQFGSGGRATGRLLAERLGIPYYDKELLAEAAHSLGFSGELFAKADEKRPSMLRSMLGFSYGSTSADAQSGSLTGENLYSAQSKVIRSIAGRGPCVIVGRTADYVNRDLDNLVSVFIHAPLHQRASRILNRKECDSETHACELAQRKDKDRQSYYNYYTGRNWGTAANYDLCINANGLHPETVAEIILDYLARRCSASNETK